MQKYYRLEYNESTGKFHLESDKTKPENVNGWYTISRGLHEKTCMRFIEAVTEKYKLNNHRKQPPLFIVVQNDFFMRSTWMEASSSKAPN